MKNGIYGIASLNGAPIDPRDLATLSLIPGPQTFHDGGCAIRISDSQPSAIDIVETHDGVCALLGHLDEPHDVADQLGLDRNTGAATLAAAAHARWGVDMATKLLGEWLMVRWHSAARRLTLVMGECIRDHCYFATNGATVALSPALPLLARLSWTSADLDPDMLLHSMGPHAAREAMNGRTMAKDIAVLRGGEQVVIDAGRTRRSFATPFPTPPIRKIAFDDAIVELRETLHRILTQQLERSGDAALLLSGGLDSSLLAAFGVGALQPGARMLCLTSAAPAGSAVEDETRWAAMVSDHLGLPMIKVTPAVDCDIYKPGERTFRAFETPLQSPRHYLYDALEDAALDRGCSALVDGAFGELTVTNDPAYERPRRRFSKLRRVASHVRDALGRSGTPRASFVSLVNLSPEARNRVAHFAQPAAEPVRDAQGAAFGILHGAIKAAGQPTHCSTPALRCLYPFRDRRMIRLMAHYPASFATHGGTSRAPARHMVRGQLPPAIVERTSKLAFSPTHELLLRQHARDAHARLIDDPIVEASQWLDIAWLKTALLHIDAGQHGWTELAAEVQTTAVAVEFFRWWRREALVTPR